MGLFSRNKKEKSKAHSKSHVLTVSKHEQLTPESARISFDVPNGMKESYVFKAGQYLNLHCPVNGEILNRSYSICSGENETLSVAVKAVNGGKATIAVTSVMTLPATDMGAQAGIPMKMEMKGTQDGTMDVDVASGQIISGKTTQVINGKMTASGQEMPMDIKGDIVITSKKR